MSEPINWCNLKENVKHLGEVVTSRQDGKPNGAAIQTSTDGVTGKERDTLDTKLNKFDTQLSKQDADFDANINRQEQIFQDRFSVLEPIEWAAETEVTNPLQVYKHTDAAGAERTYLADPALVPFTTESTFADDATLNRWVADDVLTRMKQWRDVGDVRGWGARCDGEDVTAIIHEAFLATKEVYLPAGRFTISGLSVTEFKKLKGEGRSTAVTLKGVYGIDFAGQNITVENIFFEGDATTAFTNSEPTPNMVWNNVSIMGKNFGKLGRFSNYLYYSSFNECYFHDVESAWEFTSQTANAVSFTNCMFSHYQSGVTAGTHALSFTGCDGISFSGCTLQNHGWKFSKCNGISITGGYIEGYTAEVLTAIDSGMDISGVFVTSATIFKIDDASYIKSKGLLPPTNKYMPLLPSHPSPNILAVPYMDSPASIWALPDSYGANPYLSMTWNEADSFIYAGVTSTPQTSRLNIGSTHNGAAVYLKVKVTAPAGSLVRFSLSDVQSPSGEQLSDSPEMQTVRLWSNNVGKMPFFWIAKDADAALEIHEMIVCDSAVSITDPQYNTSSPSLQLSAWTKTVLSTAFTTIKDLATIPVGTHLVTLESGNNGISNSVGLVNKAKGGAVTWVELAPFSNAGCETRLAGTELQVKWIAAYGDVRPSIVQLV